MDLKITIPIDINIDELSTSKAKIQKHLDILWSGYESKFSKELMLHGLTLVLKDAITNAIEDSHQIKYKHETIKTTKDGWTDEIAKWLLTSQKFIKRIRIGIHSTIDMLLE